jgi:hypothetical protein
MKSFFIIALLVFVMLFMSSCDSLFEDPTDKYKTISLHNYTSDSVGVKVYRNFNPQPEPETWEEWNLILQATVPNKEITVNGNSVYHMAWEDGRTTMIPEDGYEITVIVGQLGNYRITEKQP